MIKRIVVGVDGSPYSTDAVAWAADLARSLDAEVVAVHAIGLLEAPSARDAAGLTLLRETFVTTWCSKLSASDVARRFLLLDGDPVSVLLRAAEDLAADLIVVGTRGVGDRAEMLLGSTSTQVAQRSAVPVVVVPRAD